MPVSRTFAFKLAAIWLAWSIVIAIGYSGTNVTFLRAESGWFLSVAHSNPPPHFAMLGHFLRYGYHGHYTPFAFYAELEWSYLLGPRETLWRWRQIGALTLLAVSMSLLLYNLARVRRLSPAQGGMVAGGVTAFFVFQPLMRELFAWPFLALQIVAGSFSAIAAFALVRWMNEPAAKKWIWLGGAISYLSMHLVGYGLATVMATGSIFALVLAGIYFRRLPSFVPVKRTLIICLIAMLVLAGLHGGLMEWLRGVTSPSPNIPPVDVKSVLVFFVALFLSAVRSLVSFEAPPSFDNNQLPSSLWPWGLFLLIITAACLMSLARACLQEPSPTRLTRFVLVCFSVVAFCGFIVTAVARQLTEPDPSGFHNFLLGPRYIVPANLLLFGLFAVVALEIACRARSWATWLFVLLGLTALVASKEFNVKEYPQLFGSGPVSHAKAWRAIVSLSRQCRAANLPVPNLPMAAFEFRDWDLKLYEPLLRYSLNLAPENKIEFEPWEKVRGIEFEKYKTAAPSLPQVMSLMKLK